MDFTSRLQCTLLAFLYSCNAFTPLKGLSIKEIANSYTDCQYNTIYKTIKQLESFKLITCGLKDKRACTYYINEKGIEEYTNMKGDLK